VASNISNVAAPVPFPPAGNVVERKESMAASCCSLAFWANVFWSIVSVVYLFAMSCCDVSVVAALARPSASGALPGTG